MPCPVPLCADWKRRHHQAALHSRLHLVLAMDMWVERQQEPETMRGDREKLLEIFWCRLTSVWLVPEFKSQLWSDTPLHTDIFPHYHLLFSSVLLGPELVKAPSYWPSFNALQFANSPRLYDHSFYLILHKVVNLSLAFVSSKKDFRWYITYLIVHISTIITFFKKWDQLLKTLWWLSHICRLISKFLIMAHKPSRVWLHTCVCVHLPLFFLSHLLLLVSWLSTCSSNNNITYQACFVFLFPGPSNFLLVLPEMLLTHKWSLFAYSFHLGVIWRGLPKHPFKK